MFPYELVVDLVVDPVAVAVIVVVVVVVVADGPIVVVQFDSYYSRFACSWILHMD